MLFVGNRPPSSYARSLAMLRQRHQFASLLTPCIASTKQRTWSTKFSSHGYLIYPPWPRRSFRAARSWRMAASRRRTAR